MQEAVKTVGERLAYSVPEAAATLGISASTVWLLIRAGKIGVVRLGGRTIVPSAQLQKILEP